MIEIIWILGIVFFTFMTVYNAVAYRKNKTSILPTIFGFLLTLVTLLLFLEQPLLLISFLMLALFLLSVIKYPEISKIQEKRYLEELKNADLNEPFKVKDLVLGLKGWGKLAVKWGAKKTALIYSLSMAIFVGLGLLTMSILIPDFGMRGYFVLEMVVIFTVGFYYQMHKTLVKYLGELADNG